MHRTLGAKAPLVFDGVARIVGLRRHLGYFVCSLGDKHMRSIESGRRCALIAGWLFAMVSSLGAGCGSDHGSGGAAYPLDDTLRLNHIQVLGSHNSYHIQPQGRLARGLPIQEWQYTHIPLDQQFETQGIRQIELDVFADPDGGLYANPIGAQIAGDEFDVPELLLPGIKVVHVQDLDFQSNCWTFIDCLTTVKMWSDANPGHVPITILVEAKDDIIDVQLPGVPELTVPIEWDRDLLDGLDAEILSVFPLEQIITPDEVRGTHATLEEAVTTDGWPTLGESRGRVLFALDNGGRVKSAYLDGHPSLEGRILFTDSSPGAPEAAFVKRNGPIGNVEEIQGLVAAGFIVRTRADGDTKEARSGDTTQRDAAIASGAQFVSTDYPVPNPDFGTGYLVEIPGGMPARCNPISAPPECTAADVESSDLLQTFE